MISVTEASALILSHLYKPATVIVTLEQAVGHVLAEPIAADRDMPPFDRVTMDGIAINFSAWKAGTRRFHLGGMQAAGEPRKKLEGADHAIEVMTGAMLPEGTDTVIRYEDLAMAPPFV